MPLASITRDVVQTLIGHGMTDEDFAKLLVLQAEASGLKLPPRTCRWTMGCIERRRCRARAASLSRCPIAAAGVPPCPA